MKESKPKPKSNKASARETKKEELIRKATEMRKNAMPLRKIAAALGVSHETIRNYLEVGLERLRAETMADMNAYRAVQIARREEIIEAHKEIACDPDHENWKQSADIIDKNETAISKLMGTDQPIQIEQKTEHSGEVSGAMFVVHEPETMPAMTEPEEVDDGDDNAA